MEKRGGIYRLVVHQGASLVNGRKHAPRGLFFVCLFAFYFSLIVLFVRRDLQGIGRTSMKRKQNEIIGKKGK